MNRHLVRTILAALVCGLVLGFMGCAPKVTPGPGVGGASLAVAGFTHPRFTWELLAGYLPDRPSDVTDEVLAELDAKLAELLREHGVSNVTASRITRQCQEIVVFESDNKRQAAFDYWLKVGKCIPTDYLLVPQVLCYRDRVGGDWGATQTASVTLDLYLIDVREGKLVERAHFDETQQPLSENMLEAGKFFKRGGKFLSAMKLATEGLDQCLTELGL